MRYICIQKKLGREHFFAEDYEKPKKDFLDMDTTKKTVEDCVDEILSYLLVDGSPGTKGIDELIDQRLNEGLNVCIAIRDVEKSDSNPFTPTEIKKILNVSYKI